MRLKVGVIVILSLFLVIVSAVYFFLPSENPENVSFLSDIEVSSGFETLLSLGRANDSFVPSAPTIETVYSENHYWVATLSASRVRTIVATGDVIPARAVNVQTNTRGDFTWPFQKTAQNTSLGDITLINLETPLLKDCPRRNDGMIFCGDARHIQGLLSAGVDVAGIGNNHAGNFGKTGVDETIRLLTDNGILVSGGDNQPVYKDVRGVKFSFLAYNDIEHEQAGIGWAENEIVTRQIQEAKKLSDIVIVSFHWGPEYVRQPSERQKELGHLAVEAGADVVVGNHPHWVQPIELYKGKFITYAHGNFVFDQEWSEETKLGVVGRYTFYDTQLIDVEFLPIRIVEYGQPYFLEGDEKKRVLSTMEKASVELRKKQQ